ncbi:unnamed protein product [Boreogadus saida]
MQGPSWALQRSSKQVSRPRPLLSDLSPQPKAPGGPRLSPQSLSPGSSSSSSPSSSSPSSSSSSSSTPTTPNVRLQLMRNPVIPGTVKLPHGLLAQSRSLDPGPSPQAARGSRPPRRARDPAGRRKDITQSMYLDGAAASSSSSVSMTTPVPPCQQTHGSAHQGQRRFSDPDPSRTESTDA